MYHDASISTEAGASGGLMTMATPTEQHLEGLLKSLGFQKIRRGSSGFTALCKFHNDKNPSFSIGDNGLWMCFSCCEKGNLRQLIARLGFADQGDWKSSLKLVGIRLEGYRIKTKKKTTSRAALPEDFSEYSMPAEVPPKISSRLSWDTIKHFRLGSCHGRGPNAGRCIIPIIYKSSFIGYHGRALEDYRQPRYYNPKDFDIKDHLFNYDSCVRGKELFVVEGAFNAMSMWEKGFNATVATFGTKFKPEQVGKIVSLVPSRVVLCFDRDSKNGHPGQRAAMKLGKILSGLMLDVDIMPLPFDKDPNELDAETLRICYTSKVPFSRLAR